MTESRKVNRRLALVAIPLLALMIFGMSCDQAESTTPSTPTTTEASQSSEVSTTPETATEPEPSQMPDDGTMPTPSDNTERPMPADGGQPPMASDNMSRPMSQPGGGMGMSLIPDTAALAGALGVTQEALEDAIVQAQEEMMAGLQPPSGNETPPEEMTPGEMPEGTPPEMTSPDSLYAKVAEILGIDQDALEAAITEVMAALQESAPPPQ